MSRTSSILCALMLIVGGVAVTGISSTAEAQAAPADPAKGDSLLADDAGDPGATAYIVKFKAGTDRSAEVRKAHAGGLGVQRELKHVFSGMVVTATAAEAATLARNGRVETIEKDASVHAAGVQGGDLPWGLDRIDQRSLPLDGSYSYPDGGSTVTAYVIDSGLNADHSEFAGRISYGAGVAGEWDDCSGHGTHVAGTLGGTTYGVAKSVLFKPVRVLDCDGAGLASLLISGIDWVVGDHVTGTPAVANISIAVDGGSQLVEDAIARLTSDGVTTAVSAGNNATDACHQSPASAPSAITVAASSQDDTEAWFSNFGSCVDIYAPGDSVRSAGIGSTSGFAVMSGTSMASPHVAGAAALVLAAHPGWTPGQVSAQLSADATVGAIQNPTAGTVNRLLAVGILSSSTPTVSGTARVGNTLTASPGTWGPAPVGLAYQWLRGSAVISGATSASYKVQAADVGATLAVRVTGTKSGYATVARTSIATARVAVLALAVVPRLSDTSPVVEQKVTVTPAVSVPDGVAWRYQWYRKSPSGRTYRISSATQETYAVKASDRGFRLRVKVTGSLAGYASATKTSAWTSKVARATFTTAPAPAISGVSRVAMKLTATPGAWSPTATLKYQWYRVSSSGTSTAIKRATRSSYTPTAADKGRRLKVRVQGSRSGFVTATRYSKPTSPVLPGMVGVTPRVSDTTPVVDQELTAVEGSWTPSEVAFRYQWYARSRSGRTYTISGATAKTYRVAAKYAGHRIRVKVTASRPDYAPTSKSSSFTSAVAKPT